jgi:osmotically-inducible protein OsmY
MRVMKNTALALITFLSFETVVLTSCSENKDEMIKADLTTKAKSDKDFLGVRFTVENGIVTLSGQTPTEKARGAVCRKVKRLYGVKGVVNNLNIGAVVVGTDELLRQSVDSVLSNYAGVQAVVKDSIVELEGKLGSKESEKLLAAIEKLGPERVENKLIIK